MKLTLTILFIHYSLSRFYFSLIIYYISRLRSNLRSWILFGLVVRGQYRIIGNVDVDNIADFQLIGRQFMHL